MGVAVRKRHHGKSAVQKGLVAPGAVETAHARVGERRGVDNLPGVVGVPRHGRHAVEELLAHGDALGVRDAERVRRRIQPRRHGRPGPLRGVRPLKAASAAGKAGVGEGPGKDRIEVRDVRDLHLQRGLQRHLGGNELQLGGLLESALALPVAEGPGGDRRVERHLGDLRHV